MTEYKWLTESQADLYLFKELFDSNNSDRTIEHLKWQYIDSYNNSNRFVLAGMSDSQKLSGVYAIFQNRFVCDGKEIVGSQSLDTLVAPESRGQGLFNKFATEVYKVAAEKKVGFVYGFPNGNSAHGFFNKLNWKNLDPLPFLILPISSRYVLSKIPLINKFSKFIPNFKFSKKLKSNKKFIFKYNISIDKEYDELWFELSNKIDVGINRESKYIHWRLARPAEKYNNIAVYNNDNKLIGICFYTLKEKHGGFIGYIMDLLYLEEDAGGVLLNLVVQELRKNGCDAILAWNFEHSFNHIAYKKNGFLNLPEKLRPIELHFGVRAFNSELSSVLENRESWYLSYFDSDTV